MSSFSNRAYKPKPIVPEPLPTSERIQDLEKSADAAGLIYERTSRDRNEMRLLDAIKRRPDTHLMYVTSITRVKTDRKFILNQPDPHNISNEAIIFYMKQEALLFNDKRIDDDGVHGGWLRPKTRMNKNLEGQPSSVQNQGEVPIFRDAFTPEKVDEIIAMSAIGVKDFYLQYGTNNGPNLTTGNEMTIKNIEDFKYGTFEELWDMSRYNYTKNDPCLDAWRAEGAEIKKRTEAFNTISKAAQF